MDKKKIYGIIGMIMILMLPISSSIAIADTLVATAHGSDEVPSYYRVNGDIWNFIIGASVDSDEELTADQIEIIGNQGSARLDEIGGQCQQQASGLAGNTCTLSTEYTPSISIPLVNEFKIKLYDDSGEERKSVPLILYGDLYSPMITFTTNPVQARDKAMFSYKIEERSYSENYNSRCSGIAKIEIKSGTDIIKTITLDNSSQCLYSNTAEYPTSSFRENEVTITAYDRLGHKATKTSEEFVIDTGAPVIREINILKDEQEISFLNGEIFRADISVLITENSLDSNSVYADFINIGGLENQTADSCNKYGDDYICTWNEQRIDISQAGSKTIRVSATDIFGNNALEDLNYNFKVDMTPPIINGLYTNHHIGDQSYIGYDPVNITMKISESGSGILKDYIAIDLKDFNSLYSTHQHPNNCTQVSSDTWECYWYNIYSDKDGELRTSVTQGMDLAGNFASGESRFFIKTDKTEPEILTLNVKSLSEDEYIKGIIVSGSNLMITAQIQEDSLVKGYADFSNIKNNVNLSNMPGQCIKEDSFWKCTWRVDDIISGYVNTDFTLKFVDVAGNKLEVTKDIEIYGLSEQTGNFWSLSASESMPKAIDRSTSEIINHVMAYKLNLNSAQGASLIGTYLTGCTGDTDYLENTGRDLLINNGANGEEPYILFTFKRFSSDDLNNLQITCNFNTETMHNKVIYPNEEDNITFNIGFYNSALGEASEATREKVDDLKDTYIDGWWQYVGGLNTLFRYAKGACMIFGTFRQLQQTWFGIETLLGRQQEAAIATGNLPAAAAINTKRVLACYNTETVKSSNDQSWQNMFNKLCGFVNCKMGPLPPEEEGRKTPIMDKLSVIGGRKRLCGPIIDNTGGDLIKDWTGKEAFSDFESDDYNRYMNSDGYMNVKDSMVLSVCSMCLPGIIYNLQKYRQIQCMYIDCLERSIETGVPADACDGMKDYSTCKYVLGEIFQFFPITSFLQHYLDKVRNAVSNPFKIIGLGFGIGCRQYCNMPDEYAIAGNGHKVCMGAKIISDIGQIAGNVKAVFDEDTWSPSDDYCKIIEDRSEDNGEESEEE